jgi:hypothetical protein
LEAISTLRHRQHLGFEIYVPPPQATSHSIKTIKQRAKRNSLGAMSPCGLKVEYCDTQEELRKKWSDYHSAPVTDDWVGRIRACRRRIAPDYKPASNSSRARR